MFNHCYILVIVMASIALNGAQGKFNHLYFSACSKLLHNIRCMSVYTIEVICEFPLIEEMSKAITKERQVMDHGAGNMLGVIEKRQELTVRKGKIF